MQLGIRLLVTADSALLDLEEIRAGVDPFDPASLTWPWRHGDPSVDRLQSQVMTIVGSLKAASRREVFDAIVTAARQSAGMAPRPAAAGRTAGLPPPHLTEAWYCCAEPGPDIANFV